MLQPESCEERKCKHRKLTNSQLATPIKIVTSFTHSTVWYADSSLELHAKLIIIKAISWSLLLWCSLGHQSRHTQIFTFSTSFLCKPSNNSFWKHPSTKQCTSTDIPQQSIQPSKQSILWTWAATLLLIWSHRTRLPDEKTPCFNPEKLDQKNTWMRIRNKPPCFNLVQFALPALPTARNGAELISKGLKDGILEISHRRESLPIPIVQPTKESRHVQHQEPTVLLLKPFAFSMELSVIAFTPKPTCKLRISIQNNPYRYEHLKLSSWYRNWREQKWSVIKCSQAIGPTA